MIILYEFKNGDFHEFETDLSEFKSKRTREQLLFAASHITDAEKLSNEELLERLHDTDFDMAEIIDFYYDEAEGDYRQMCWQILYDRLKDGE